jgi:hypothetical protein
MAVLPSRHRRRRPDEDARVGRRPPRRGRRGGGVGLFSDKASENPVARAIRMADGLLARKACRSDHRRRRAVAVRKKPDGTDRYVSAAFAKLQKQLEGIAATASS